MLTEGQPWIPAAALTGCLQSRSAAYTVEVGTGGTEVPFGSLGAAALLIARFCEYPGPVVEQLAELVFLAPGVLPGPVEFAGGVLADPVELGGGAGPRLLAFAGCVFPYPCGLEHP